ncbi:MAG: ATP-binding protein [Anaerolineae bacterium]|nr:ATP-binding protein [Anaerolineae bacterium]
MTTTPWFKGATPHISIQEGKVNEALFEAKLGEAIYDRGPEEYRDATRFFEKTYLTAGLRQLLLDVLHTVNGERAANAIVNLKTSFGGGKTHTELAIYHLFKHPSDSLKVGRVRELVAEAGLAAPPPCRVAVLPCTRIDPTGRTTEEGLRIRTLWGEMAYLLGGPVAFALVADADAKGVSPGEASLEAVLRHAGPSIILFDETLHYVAKVSEIASAEGDLAKQTVAFLRELTGVVDALPCNMLIVSLTASRPDQIGAGAQFWLERLEQHVNRLARPCTPIEGTEIHEVVRRRLFDHVDAQAAAQTADDYYKRYATMGGLPAQYTSAAYRDLIYRSYPFHPELITVLYERWGAKPGFQLTRGTLRFLALVLQDLWSRRTEVSPDLIQMGYTSMKESRIRALVRDIAGDPQWESVLGSDIAAPSASEQLAKAEILDQERDDDLALARSLATTILLYSIGGNEDPTATRHEIRLSCARVGVEDSTWDNLLKQFQQRFFYLYYEDAHYKFRKEPNVTSLQHTYRVNLSQTGEVEARINRMLLQDALGDNSPSHGFAHVYYVPQNAVDRDDDTLKLVVLGFDHPMEGKKPSDEANEQAMGILEHHSQVLRQHRNTLVFCVPDREAARKARDCVADYLSWQKIQQNPADWDRIGATQQAVVKQQIDDTRSAALQAITSAYSWVLLPNENVHGTGLDFRIIPLGSYGPGMKIVPMVWDSLTAKTPTAQWLLKSLTAETFLERYGAKAWPESERCVTTAQLWQRFTSQVGLPIMASERVLIEMLRQGQQEGMLAIGSLTDAQAPRDQRDSYLHPYFKETMEANVPVIGDRWLVMRPLMYSQIAEQPELVTTTEIIAAVEELGGADHPIMVKRIQKIVASDHHNNIDLASFQNAITAVVKEQSYGFEVNGVAADVPEDIEQIFGGALVKKEPTSLPPKSGRTIVVRGTLASPNDMGPFFKKILQPIASQQPDDLTIELHIRAHFKEDPGSGLDATLDDGFDNNAFPGLRRENH